MIELTNFNFQKSIKDFVELFEKNKNKELAMIFALCNYILYQKSFVNKKKKHLTN